eukprot:jgi/Astpho2/6855/Aster-06527
MHRITGEAAAPEVAEKAVPESPLDSDYPSKVSPASYEEEPPQQPQEVQSQQQLASAVRHLATQVIRAHGTRQKEHAVLKLYAVLSQAQFVQHRASEWEAAFVGLLEVGVSRFLKHAAGVVIRKDKGFSNMAAFTGMVDIGVVRLLKHAAGMVIREDKGVRAMAAAILKILTRWLEHQLAGSSPVKPLVAQALQKIAQDALPRSERRGKESGQSSIPGSMLDTGSLVGLLDSSANHGSAGTARESSLMDSGLLGTAMDTGRLQALVHQSHGMGEGVMGTHHLNTQHISSLGSALDTEDVADQIRQHRGAIRAAFWLIKARAIGGGGLVKPILWVLKSELPECQGAAMRALSHLARESQACATLAQHDSYLKAIARALHRGNSESQFAAVVVIKYLVAHSASTHYVLAQAGAIPGLLAVLKYPHSPLHVKAAGAQALKQLTLASQKNRNQLLTLRGLDCLLPLLAQPSEEVQYHTARMFRHLALGSQPEHRVAALRGAVPLTLALQSPWPRVQYAAASALAMLAEGHPAVCESIMSHEGPQALAKMLRSNVGHARQAAAEAMQALAAEGQDLTPVVLNSHIPAILVHMLGSGSPQQQTAAAGALQSLALQVEHHTAFMQCGAVPALVDMMGRQHVALASAAAGALCNLSLGSTQDKVMEFTQDKRCTANAGASRSAYTLCFKHALNSVPVPADAQGIALVLIDLLLARRRNPETLCLCLQMCIVDAEAIPVLIEILLTAQADGQYSCAATLTNLAIAGKHVRLAMMVCEVVPAAVRLLQAESWYCRTIAAELLSRLALDAEHRQIIESAHAVKPLCDMLGMRAPQQALDPSQAGATTHLVYERGEDVIVMKGYKFSRAKLAATAALGCLASSRGAVAEVLAQGRLRVGQADSCCSAAPHAAAAAAAAAAAGCLTSSTVVLAEEPCFEHLLSLLEVAGPHDAALAAATLAVTADFGADRVQLDTALVRNITSEFPAGEAAVLALASMSLPYQPALGREALEGAAKRLSVMAQEGDQRLQQASQRVRKRL